ncbi:MAG: PAS domain-containing protein [Leptolyngbyaceae cyanobacterium RU_5_1]|nr:PAS domain-containing protein [Leptolyngbyaceae cyanobacterium RU_5_1]
MPEIAIAQIIQRPLTIPPDASVQEAIAQLHHADTECVLVVEPARSKLIGLFTERDLVRLIGLGTDLASPIHTVMRTPVVTINTTQLQDVSTVLSVFDQYSMRYLPIVNKQGQSVGLLSQSRLVSLLNQNLSDRNQTENDLKESEERWQLAIKGSNDGIFDVDLRTGKTFHSPRWSQILGYEADEISDHNDEWSSRIHPDDIEGVMAADQAHLNRQTPYFMHEYRMRCKDGSYKWVLGRAQALWNEQGKAVRLVGSHSDISDRKQAENDLKESEERWQLAIKGSNDGIWDHNLQTNQHYLSPRCMELLGYDYDEIDTFDKWVQRVHPDDVDRLQTTFQAHVAHQLPSYGCEYRVQCKDGNYKWLLARGQALWDEQGNPVRAVGSITDISDRKQVEAALADRERYLAALVEIQRELLASPQGHPRYTEILRELGQASGTSRVYLFENHRDPSIELLMTQRAEWRAAGVDAVVDSSPFPDLIYEDFFPSWWLFWLQETLSMASWQTFQSLNEGFYNPKASWQCCFYHLR